MIMTSLLLQVWIDSNDHKSLYRATKKKSWPRIDYVGRPHGLGVKENHYLLQRPLWRFFITTMELTFCLAHIFQNDFQTSI